MNMCEVKQVTKPTTYANGDDFCRIFQQEMDGFYQLSLLLTADREKAEQCFVSGLDDSVKGSLVFKEWAQSWARRAIIQSAVQIVRPRPTDGNGTANTGSANSNAKSLFAEKEETAAILAL